MHVATIISVVGSAFAMVVFAWQKLWLLSLVFAFGLAYTIFDKIYPTILPEHLVTGFSVCSLISALVFCWQTFSRKRVS